METKLLCPIKLEAFLHQGEVEVREVLVPPGIATEVRVPTAFVLADIAKIV